jgi:hypothetical protein
MTKLRLGQIDTSDIGSSDFASKTEVASNVSVLTANTYNTLLDTRANDFATYTTLNASINSVQANLTSVIGAAPSTLDTLAEIAAALENDANIAVTLVTAIGTVQSNLTTLTGTTAANDYNSYTTLTANTYNTLLDTRANDYNSFTTLTANTYNTLLAAQSNDGATLASAQANDFNSYTTLTANTYNTLLDTRANDYNSFTTLTANIYNTFAYLNANVGGGGDASNAWVNANDYNTYTTLVGFINTVQDNVAAGVGGDLISDQFTVSSSNIFTLSQSATSANNILVSLNGIVQRPTDDYIVAGTTLTLANIEPLASGIAVEVRHLSASSGGGSGDVANAWVNANDYNSYTTLTANIYDTYTSLFANLGVSGGNVTNTVSITPIFSGALKTASATQSVGATWTTLTEYDNVIYDTNSFTSVADRFTIPAGVTKVKLAGSVAGASATGQIITRILKNADTVVSYTTGVDIDSTGADTSPVFTPVINVVEGDYFVIQAFSDTTRDIIESHHSWFAIEVAEGSVLTATANLTISSAGNAWVNANDYTTLLSAQSNDFNSYTTLTANIYNTFAYLNANVGEGGGGDVANAWVNANDYNSYTTLTANIYNTFAYLNANVGGGGGNSAVNIISDQYTISTTNTFTLTKTVSDANNIIVSLDGIVQNPNDDYVVSGTTLTFNNTAPLPTGREVEVRHIVGGGDAANTWLNANDYVTHDTLTANIYNTFAYLNANVGGGGGGISTGKAIAMAIVFG